MNKNLKVLALTLSVLSILSVNSYASTIPSPMTFEEKQNFIESNPLPESQKNLLSEKRALADDYYSTRTKQKSWGGSKTNPVGTNTQSSSFYCGPASAQNLIQGYVSNFGGNVPTQLTLSNDLLTVSGGTPFGPGATWAPTLNKYAPGNNYVMEWISTQYGVESNIIWTIDKSYNVILDINHDNTNPYPIHPQYANGIGHYVTIYGYNDSNKTCSISDSNGPTRKYTTGFKNAYYSGMGMVW